VPSPSDRTSDQLAEAAASTPVVDLSGVELDRLLRGAVIAEERNTLISGMIRVLEVGPVVLVQEETPDGRALLRRVASRAEADEFLADRLATYERMWDGCGCKVHYFE